MSTFCTVLVCYFLCLQVYGEGSGYECRKHVQRLNLLRKTMDEQALNGSDEDIMKCDTDPVAVTDCVPEDLPTNQLTVSQFGLLSSQCAEMFGLKLDLDNSYKCDLQKFAVNVLLHELSSLLVV